MTARHIVAATALVLSVTAVGCGPSTEGGRTPGSVGATLLLDVEKFAIGYQPAVEALADVLEMELDLDPGEYYVNLIVDPSTNVFTFTLWHRIAFEPKYANVSNPGGKCFTITLDPKTEAFGTPEYWK